jgi:hypothetical protein
MRQGRLAAGDFALGAALSENRVLGACTDHSELSRRPSRWAQSHNSRPSSADDKRDRRGLGLPPPICTDRPPPRPPARSARPATTPTRASRHQALQPRPPDDHQHVVAGRRSPVTCPRQPRRRRCPQPAGVAARCAYAASSSPSAAAQARPAHRPSDPAGSQRPPPGGPTPGTSRPSELIRVRRKHLRTDAPGVTWIG